MPGPSILAVDDNPSNLKLVSVLLSSKGYDVHVASNATEALAEVQRSRPRLILMDLQLPGMDGFELTRKLKADPQTRDILIIALTAYAMKGDDERALASGCDGYVSKPIDTKMLLATIERYLAGAG